MEDQCVITREITVAAGVFAPGHLGELTQIVPFEMVDQALAVTGTTQARLRVLPSRVVVYLLLAGCLFAELGYRQVWHKLTAALSTLPVAGPSDNALWQARARLGAAPLRWLFDLLRVPATAITAGPVRWCGLVVCAIDGTTMTIPDSPRNLAACTKQAGSHGGPGYPLLRLVALVTCGTRTIIDAVFGPTSTSEQDYTRRLRHSLHAGMLVLLDRNFDVAMLIGQLAATKADLLVRVKANRKLPVLRRYHDGSYLSQIGTVRVRVAECQITIATSAGRHAGVCRLATTLLDHRQHPAAALVTLYHQRWEIEMVFTQLAKRAVRPVGGGREHVADLDLVVGDDDTVDEQLGQLPPLLEGSGVQPGADGLAEALDAVGDGLQFEALPCGGVQLALLGEQGGVPTVQVLTFAVEFGQGDDLGEVGVQQPLLLAL